MSKPIRTINERWHEFKTALKLDRPDVPAVQRQEMKRAFFAGFESMLIANYEIADLSEDEGVARLQRFTQEARGFAEAVKQGAA